MHTALWIERPKHRTKPEILVTVEIRQGQQGHLDLTAYHEAIEPIAWLWLDPSERVWAGFRQAGGMYSATATGRPRQAQ
ncbi:MAG TPA: hypothetical protein DDY29_14595 [Rhodobacteraceae bacterium]|nr:hypothetical protein [Paracoccaceae bacterium]